MRNWHHNVIRLSQARQLIINHNNSNPPGEPDISENGNPNIYVGVIEGKIEFERINEGPLVPNNYRAVHSSFADTEPNQRKVFFRWNNNNLYSQIPNDFKSEPHTVCVTGIIAGNIDLANSIQGVVPSVKVINSTYHPFVNHAGINSDLLCSLYISLINETAGKNSNSDFYKSKFPKDNYLSYSGSSEPADVYSGYAAGIINCSFEIDLPKEKSNFIFNELYAYGRNGRGCLIITSAGNETLEINTTNTSSSGYRVAGASTKPLIVGASKVLLNVSALPSYDGVNPVFTEEKADYSNYGKRMDLCAPSGPDSTPSSSDIYVYAPSIINGGNIGTPDEVFLARILSVENKRLVLEDIRGVFPGQSIELGNVNSFHHEVRYISSVNPVAGTNNIEVTLEYELKFTKTINTADENFSLVDTFARIVVLKKEITLLPEDPGTHIIPATRFTLHDLRGTAVKAGGGQKVYIYRQGEPLTGVYTEITSINAATKIAEVNTSIATLFAPAVVPLILIPGQISTSVKCQSKHVFVPTNNDEIRGFFAGQRVHIKNSGLDHVVSISEMDPNGNFQMKHVTGIIGDIYKITSRAYGSFTSEFSGTSSSTPVVTGLAALLLSANGNLNATELKHILKVSASQIGNVTYNDAPGNSLEYNYGYQINKKFGTGRINAEAAVQLALNWHTDPTVQKPNLIIADKEDGGVLDGVLPGEPVNSPDIWIKKLSDPDATPPAAGLNNTLHTSEDQKLYVRVSNAGNRASFLETDVRVFIAFTNEVNPAFPFPESWAEQDKTVKLISVLGLPITAPGASGIVSVEWKDIRNFWDINNAPVAGARRKRAYVLVHVAPFDGLPNQLSLTNIRNNKQLTCKEIIATHTTIKEGDNYLTGNELKLKGVVVGTVRNFVLTVDNLSVVLLNTFIIRLTKKPKDGDVEIVNYSKNAGGAWDFAVAPSSDWITFEAPVEDVLDYNPDYMNLKFSYAIKINEALKDIKIEIINS